MSDRGQTAHDYLLGMVLVLLTVAAVFAFFPEVFVPFEDPVETEEQHMAGRLADEVVEVNRTVREERTVNVTGLEWTLRDPDAFHRLTERSGIPEWKQVNVAIRGRDGKVLATSTTSDPGSVFRSESSSPAATRVRTIMAHNRSSECADSCQVVVRVWTGGS
jgi:hypothetical protein